MTEPDHLDADRLSAPGERPVLVVDAAKWRRPSAAIQAVIIGFDRDGTLPTVAADDYDILATTSATAPAPWVALRSLADVERLANAVRATPYAATTAAQALRLASQLPFADALTAESFAYSTTLGGAEFARWLHGRTGDDRYSAPQDSVKIDREGDELILTLNTPRNHNAMTAAMRDALYEGLANALDDPSRPRVFIKGEGKCFSTGGHLPEFGTARDLVEAHVVRTLHSCARALNALGPRATVRVHGACIGSGIEVAAAAHRRIAAPDAWFQLPELGMGLIPGAGGTATMTRAIGRHRTMWMLLSGKRVGAKQALEWGLVHSIEGDS